MKKIGILTINDYTNLGNRLQNYSVQKILENYELEVETIQNQDGKFKLNLYKIVKKLVGNILKKYSWKKEHKRYINFIKFDRNIKKTRFVINNKDIPTEINEKYDFFVTGSDQVWNPNFNRMTEVDFLTFADKNKRISFAASFGIEKIPDHLKRYCKERLEDLKYISVREEAGKKIIDELTGRNDVDILVDPTMLLTLEEWNKVEKRPKNLYSGKYILNYFLGNLSEERKKEIERIASENNCKIINILDKKDSFYESGPSEFLYLERNAFLICTDSFHSCVFAILYKTPFIVFNREDKEENMNSRIDTLLSKFNLMNRVYNGRIKEVLLKNDDFNGIKDILEKEKEKANIFLKKALDIKEKGEISEN